MNGWFRSQTISWDLLLPAIPIFLIVDVNPKTRGRYGGGANSAAISLEVPTPPIVKFRDPPALAELGLAIGVDSRAVLKGVARDGLGSRNNAARPLIVPIGNRQADR